MIGLSTVVLSGSRFSDLSRFSPGLVAILLPPVFIASLTGTRDVILSGFMLLTLACLERWENHGGLLRGVTVVLLATVSTLVELQGGVVLLAVGLIVSTGRKNQKILATILCAGFTVTLASLLLLKGIPGDLGDVHYFPEFWYGQVDLNYIGSILSKWGLSTWQINLLFLTQALVTLLFLGSLVFAVDRFPGLSLYVWLYLTLTLVFFTVFKTEVQYTIRHFMPVLPLLVVFAFDRLELVSRRTHLIVAAGFILYSTTWLGLFLPELSEGGFKRYGALSDWLRSETTVATRIYTPNLRELNYFSPGVVLNESKLKAIPGGETPIERLETCCDYVIFGHFPRSTRKKALTLIRSSPSSFERVKRINRGSPAAWSIYRITPNGTNGN